jgi:hypothetical protein
VWKSIFSDLFNSQGTIAIITVTVVMNAMSAMRRNAVSRSTVNASTVNASIVRTSSVKTSVERESIGSVSITIFRNTTKVPTLSVSLLPWCLKADLPLPLFQGGWENRERGYGEQQHFGGLNQEYYQYGREHGGYGHGQSYGYGHENRGFVEMNQEHERAYHHFEREPHKAKLSHELIAGEYLTLSSTWETSDASSLSQACFPSRCCIVSRYEVIQ